MEVLKIRAEREAGAWAIRGGHGTEEATVDAIFSLGGVLAEDPRQTRVWVLKLGMYRLQRGRTGGGKHVREELSTQARAMESTKGPSQRKHVAPPGVGRTEREDTVDVLGLEDIRLLVCLRAYLPAGLASNNLGTYGQ